MGWALGTYLGAAAGDLLPMAVTQALGIAIYGMFLAIMLPPFRHCREVRLVVLVSAGMSCAFAALPFLQGVTGGFRIIVCAVAAAALGAWLTPAPAADAPCEAAEITPACPANQGEVG